MNNQSLLRERRFWPLLLTAFLGAFNDNVLRAAVVIIVAMTLSAGDAARIALFAGAALSLPFVLFSGFSGTAADKFEKAGVIRWTKISELCIAAGAAAALITGSLPAMLGAIFLMGTQSAVFGPLKQGWLPERLDQRDLVQANAWMESGTFIAILSGTIIGGLCAALFGGAVVAGVILLTAVLGVIASRFLPVGQAAAPDLRLPLNPIAGNIRLIKFLGTDSAIRNATVLESWFWAMGAICLSTLPILLKEHLGTGELMVTGVMAIFAAGIGIGSFLAGRVLKGVISVWPVAPAALLVSVASLLLYVGLWNLPMGGGAVSLISSVWGLVVSASILAIAIGGGLFVVPLTAMVQSRAKPESRSRTVAAIAIVTSLAVAATTVLISLLVSKGLPVREVFLLTTLSALGAVILAVRFFPRESLQGITRLLLTAWFRVSIEGEEHLNTTGPVIYVPNHVSLIDGPLMFALIPRKTAFAMTSGWANTRMMKMIGKIVPIAAIDPNAPMSAKSLVKTIQQGNACVVFPEGRLSATGSLMKMYPGSAWMIDHSDAQVVPVHFEGLEHSRWSREKVGFRRLLRPKVRIVIGAPQRFEIDETLKGRTRREAAVLKLGDLLEAQRSSALDRHQTIPQAIAETAQIFGTKRHAIADPLGTSLTYGKFTLGAAVLGRVLGRKVSTGEHVGVLLPTAAGTPVVLTALWRLGAVPAMLNPTLGHGPTLQALGVASVRQVITSKAMIKQAKLEVLIENLQAAGIVILWTEDIRAEVGKSDKVLGLISAKFGRAKSGLTIDRGVKVDRDTTAVILFTSGTEGAPKGVVLSHGNLLSNAMQLRARTDINPSDRMFCALPLFHSLGLTGGLILPLLTATDIFAYPSPLHTKQIPEAAYIHQSTIIIGTDTFLAAWGRRASQADFGTVRAAIVGAEPVKPATREMWMKKFGTRLLEGYGATECAPVLALNSTIVAKDGTVGRMLPGMDARLEEVPGVTGQRLWVRGPNVMKGYLLESHPGEIVAPENGWYDTGDCVLIDKDGFVTITGRIKRFAKVGGEMVSLAAVEALAARTWPDEPAAAIALPDPRKGNKVVLCRVSKTDRDTLRKELQTQARADGIAEIMLPAEILIMSDIPLLASGKINYPELTKRVTAE